MVPRGYESESEPPVRRGRSPSLARRANIALFVALAVFVCLSAYLYWKLNGVSGRDPGASSAAEVQALLATVGKLMVLPANETPTVATVRDLAALKGQSFFARAKVGDKVLIFFESKKAILYSPSENKVVEVAPISEGSSDVTFSSALYSPSR